MHLHSKSFFIHSISLILSHKASAFSARQTHKNKCPAMCLPFHAGKLQPCLLSCELLYFLPYGDHLINKLPCSITFTLSMNTVGSVTTQSI